MGITDKNYVPNPAEQFILDRMREFPSLYPNSNSVISATVFNNMGGAEWTENGLIVCSDQYYDKKSGKWGPYPKVISEEVARSLYLTHQGNFPKFGYRIGYCSKTLIDCIPLNADSSWLKEINHFLYQFEKYDEELIRLTMTVKCLLNYGVKHNPYADEPNRSIREMTDFVKRVPSWRARIREIEYYQQNGHIEAATYLGIDI